MIVIATVIAFYIMTETRQRCDVGCLRCASDDVCQICEFTSNYALKNGTCVTTKLENCSTMSNEGLCLICNPPYYADANTGKCVSVEQAFVVNGCSGYTSKQVCLGCSSGFYINDGACVAVKIQVANCDLYENDGKCSTCALGYYLSLDGKSCLAKSTDPNCRRSTSVSCASCNDGYILDPNNFATQYNAAAQSLVNLILNDQKPLRSMGVQQVCVQSTTPNCLQPLTYKRCQVCQAGFYLTADGNCAPNPAPLISNCKIYLSESACQQCQDGYYLKAAAQCVAVDFIENCVRYDPTSFESKCVECLKDYYVSNRLCTKRSASLSINNCGVLNVSQDVCDQCSEGYALTSDKLRCLSAVSNCNSYASSSVSTTSLSCTACNNLYYLSEGSCVSGSVENCFTYKPDQNVCVECKNKFFLSSGKCEPHISLRNCLQYSLTANMTCTQCGNSTSLFTLQNYCTPVTIIANCSSYSSSGSCTDCYTGSFLNGTVCSPIPSSFPNCKTYVPGTPNKCTVCLPGFVLDTTTNTCMKPYSYMTLNCANVLTVGTTFAGASRPSCSYCMESSVPTNLQNHFICIQPTHLKLIGISTAIGNCTRYTETGSCLQCANGMAITSTGECASACDAGKILLTHDYTNGKVNSCVDSSLIANCDALVKLSSNTYACLKPASGYYPLVTMAIKTMVPFRAFETKHLPTYLNYEGFLLSPVNSVTPVENCELYYTSGGISGCLKCAHGYTGALDVTSTFITACTENLECHATIFHAGLLQYLNKVLSCHSCKTYPRLPLVGVKGNNLDWSALKTPTGKNLIVSCAAKPANLHEKCGVMFELFDDITPANNGVFCGACLPGYKPTYFSSTNKVDTCTLIANCAQTQRQGFNQCSRCEKGYSFPALATSPYLDLTQCVATTAANCLVVNADLSCKYCNPGFRKNRDGVCVHFQIPYCDQGKSQPYFASLSFTEFFVLSYFTQLNGCISCSGNTVAVKEVNSNQVCLPSSVLMNNIVYTPTQFITNCLNYWDSGTSLICMQCKPGYLATSDNLKCVARIANCKIAQAANNALCATCSDKSININGACVEGDVSFCMSYNPSSADTPRCNACKNGYYLVSDRLCSPGKVVNCARYPNGQPTKCSKCLPQYQLVINTQSVNFCFPIDPALNCKAFDPDKFLQNILSCVECQQRPNPIDPPYYLGAVPATLPFTTLCMDNPKTPNCTKYDAKSVISLSSFKCTECDPTSILSPATGQCANRTVAIEGCLTYDPAYNLCSTCDSQHILSTDRASCIIVPTGVSGCVEYSDSKTCKKCGKNLYLERNVCKTVDTPIANCQINAYPTICEVCDPGFVLINGECKQGLAQNCLTFTNISACETCPSGKGLKFEVNTTNCVPVTKDQCTAFNQTAPYPCLICNSNFYPDATGGCAPVTTKIDSCSVYDSATTCALCNPGYLLSSSKIHCMNDLSAVAYMDPQCAEAFELNATVCSECEVGYTFANDTCTKCASWSSNPGCRMCPEVSGDKCLICKYGYFMNPSNLCVSAKPVDNNQGDGTVKKASRLTALLLSLALLLVHLPAPVNNQ